jgi:hypothetical protein
MELTLPDILAQLRSLPGHPVAMARFGRSGVLPASLLARRFRTDEGQALLAEMAAHAMLPLTGPGHRRVRACAHDDGARGGLAGGRRGQRPAHRRPRSQC